MSQSKVKKGFDALAFKDAAQARIHAATRRMTAEQEIAFYRHEAETGPFAEWYKTARREAEARQAADKMAK